MEVSYIFVGVIFQDPVEAELTTDDDEDEIDASQDGNICPQVG